MGSIACFVDWCREQDGLPFASNSNPLEEAVMMDGVFVGELQPLPLADGQHHGEAVS